MSSSRGKYTDKSTPWSGPKWDEKRQRWYVDRYGPSGKPEYDWLPEATSAEDDSVPRGGFGTQETSTSSPYQNISYSSSAASSAVYPPTGDSSYITSGDSGSWPSSDPTYGSSAYPTQYSSINESSSSYGQAIGSSSVPHYASPQYGPGSGSAQFVSTPAAFNSYSSPAIAQDGLQEVTSGLSSMTIGMIPEAAPSPMPVPKPIWREPDSEDYETLDPRYCQVPDKEQRNFWRVGRVFMMLWTEPAGPRVPSGGGTRNGSHISTIWLGQQVFSEIRRFVVIQEGYGNSICSPIQTYSGQATLKPNLPERQQHAIIHTSKRCPDPYSYTAGDGTIVEEQLDKDPIKVRSEQRGPEGDLDPLSRLNYSKIYTVENFVRVLNIGIVEKQSLPSLWRNSMIFRDTPAEKPARYPARSDAGQHRGSKRKDKDKRRP